MVVPDGFARLDTGSPFAEHVGPFWVDRSTRPAGFGVLVEDRHTNSVRMMHGGLLATLIDIAVGHGVRDLLGAEARVVTAELTVRYLAPAAVGDWASARPVLHRRSERAVSAECDVLVAGAVIARATAGYVRLRP